MRPGDTSIVISEFLRKKFMYRAETTKVREISKKVQEKRLNSKWNGHVAIREEHYLGKRATWEWK